MIQWLRTHLAVQGFPGGSVVKNLPANAEDTGSIPGLGRSPGEGNGTPLQYSCRENSTDRGAWHPLINDEKEGIRVLYSDINSFKQPNETVWKAY